MGLLVGCLLSAGFSVHQEATFDLIYHPQVNTSLTYMLKLEIESIPDRFTFLANLKTKVVKIKPNGDYDVESATTGAHMKHGSQDETIPDDAKPTVDTYNKKGEKIASSEEDDPTEESNPGLNSLDSITGQLTPKNPVKVGETWTAVLQPNKKLKREAGKVTYALVGTEKQGSYQTLKISFKYSETEKDVPLTAEGYVLLNQQDFSLVRFESKLKGAKFSSDPDFPNGDATISVIRD